MANKPNFTAQLEPAQLEDLRRLAKHLDLTLVSGQRTGDGSPRQLMIELAEAVKRNGVENVAAALSGVIASRSTDD